MSKHTILCPYTLYHATLSCQKKQPNTIMSKHTISFQNTLSCQYTLYNAKHMPTNSAKHYHVKIHYIMSKYTIIFQNTLYYFKIKQK